MGWNRLPSSPAWKCFELEYRRRWKPRAVGIGLLALLAVLGLQSGVSTLLFRTGGWRARWGEWLLPILSGLGFLTPIPELWLARSRPPGMPPAEWWEAPWLLSSAVAAAAISFIMPAVLATSMAPERESGRLQDLTLAGLKPGQLLIARGAACALPFLQLSLLVLVVELWTLACFRVPMVEALDQSDPLHRTMFGASPDSLAYNVSGMYLDAAASPVHLVAMAGVLVCLSAVCRRVGTALVLCYGASLLHSVLLNWGLHHLTAWWIPNEPGLRSMAQTVLAVSVELGALALLARFAIRSLTYAEEPLGPPAILRRWTGWTDTPPPGRQRALRKTVRIQLRRPRQAPGVGTARGGQGPLTADSACEGGKD